MSGALRRGWATALLVAAVLGVPAGTWAQSFPERPVRFIVPFPPGGTVDPLARLIGAKLSATLGQQFIVDNRFILVSGRPLGEPVAWAGPIVMNTPEQLDEAWRELQAGTFVKHKG